MITHVEYLIVYIKDVLISKTIFTGLRHSNANSIITTAIVKTKKLNKNKSNQIIFEDFT